MKNKILATLLSFTLIFTTTGFSFADDEVAQVPEPEKHTEQVVKEDVKAQTVEKKEVIVKDEVTKVEATPEETEEYVAPTEATTPAVNAPESTSDLGPPRVEAIYKSDTYSVTYNVYYRYPAGNGWKLGGTKTFDFPQNGVSSSWRGINVAYNQMVGNNVDKPFVYEGVEYTFNGKWEDENGNSYDRDSRLTGKEYSTDTVINIYAQYGTKNMCKFTMICTDKVSTGSGSWSEEAGAATTFSHTFTNPLDKTPVEGYEFLYWENVNDSKEKYKAGETYTCDLTKLKEDTTVEFTAVYAQIPPVDPDTPDTPVVNPDNNCNNGDAVAKTDKDTKHGVVRDKAVKTGDNAFLMMNALLLMAALATTLILILTRRRREDEE